MIQMERLTWDEIAEKYPMQWVGLIDVVYMDNDGITVESAFVKYTDKTKSELAMMAIRGEDVIPWFTTPNDTFQLGAVGMFEYNI
jgi:hypothetical protein